MTTPQHTERQVGERLRQLRRAQGFSMRECAAKAGVACSFLSKVERGLASPTVMTLQKLLEALDCGVADFFRNGAADLNDEKVVFPRARMRTLQDEERAWTYAFPSGADIRMELAIEEYAPETRVTEIESHPTDLCGIVLEGELTLELPGRGIERAKKGDAFYLRAGTEHIARNERKRPLRLITSRANEISNEHR